MEKLLIFILLFLLFLIIYFYISNSCKENFIINQEQEEDKISLYIFLTENCKFCKEFDNNKYEKLVEEIGNKMNIRKIYLNDNTKDLFIKYGISLVPAAVLEKNEHIININNGINKENIMKEFNKLENNKKKELLIFLSKKCPYCVDYLLNNHKKITDELSNDYSIKLIFSDEDQDNLFSKYKINYVPKGLLISNNVEYNVKNPITCDNINNADNANNTNYANNTNNTNNNNINNKKKILVFLSKTCPYCVKYDNETHNKLLNELNDRYDIEKIYDDEEKNEEMFKKYNIRFIPKLIIVDNNNIKEINGSITSENILKTDNNNIEHMDNYLFDDNSVNNNLFIESVIDETQKEIILKDFEDENINKKYDNIISEEKEKNKIIVFLSKTCPACINYLKNVSDKLEDEFKNEFIIENKFLDDDEENMFGKYDIDYVPQALILYNNEMGKVEGNININNIKNTITNIKNKYLTMMKMIENTSEYISDDEVNYKKITTESFSNILDNDNNIELLVFLSKSCPHCVNYDKNTHNKLEKELENNCKIRKIYPDNDSDNLFDKYNIQFVPKGILLSKDRYIPIEGALNNQTIRKYLEKINN